MDEAIKFFKNLERKLGGSADAMEIVGDESPAEGGVGGLPLTGGLPPAPEVGSALQLTRADEISFILEGLKTSKPGDSNATMASYILSRDIAPTLHIDPAKLEDEVDEEDDNVERMLVAKLTRVVDPRVFQFVQSLLNNSPNTNVRNTPPVGGVRNAVNTARFIPTCTRAWNATMLSSPHGYERPCGFGEKCICNLKFGKALKEFFTPIEMHEIETKGRRAVSVETRACLVCVRDTLTSTHLYHAINGDPHTLLMFPQPFKNEVDKAGEYLSSDCIPILTDFSLPIVMNREFGYVASYDKDTGILTLSEKGYESPSVFA